MLDEISNLLRRLFACLIIGGFVDLVLISTRQKLDQILPQPIILPILGDFSAETNMLAGYGLLLVLALFNLLVILVVLFAFVEFVTTAFSGPKKSRH